MFNLKDFGNTIRQLRKKRHIRILDVATELNISESYLGEIERGTATPSIEVTILIANYWKIPLENTIHTNYISGFTDSDYKLLYEILLNHISSKNGG